jgi:hypothetical protein
VNQDRLPIGTYYIGAGCGVPYEWAPLILRVHRVEGAGEWSPGAWLTGYELGPTGDAVAARTVYVGIVAGLRLIPARRAHQPVRRLARNAGPAVPRPRTSPDHIITGRTR